MWKPSVICKEPFKMENIIPPEMKECWNKHYTLTQNEHYDKFLHELGVSNMVAAKAVTLKSIVTFSKQNSEYVLTTSYPDARTHTLKFRLGEKVKKQSPKGLIATSFFKMKGTTLTETENVGGKIVETVREFGRLFLRVTMRVNKVKCLRIYAWSPSKHSIQTETSRRESLIRSTTIPEDLSEFEPASNTPSVVQDLNSEDNVCY